MPAGEIFTRLTYDSLSIVQASLLWLTAAGAGVMAVAFRFKISFGGAFFLPQPSRGGAVLLAQSALYPKFFMGPLVDADPFIFSGFLPKILEARSLFRAEPPPLSCACCWRPCWRRGCSGCALRSAASAGQAALPVVPRGSLGVHGPAGGLPAALGILHAAGRHDRRRRPAARHGDRRTRRYRQVLKDVPRYMRTYLSLGCCCCWLCRCCRKNPGPPAEQSFCSLQLRYAVQSQQLQPLLGDKNLILYAPQDQGGGGAVFHALPHHRLQLPPRRSGA